ncbi:hypothetical protein PoB_001343600 [Plakobranchus ocellatus]|uniref:Uncharacterized protein n=1 Tax=Plakobranchus ocellatus TaxID=259542 RepID=A0AAV3YI21_9GAST|nr:hypothetical protein PoB_001343600 [Plakobranchus ocellatus]
MRLQMTQHFIQSPSPVKRSNDASNVRLDSLVKQQKLNCTTTSSIPSALSKPFCKALYRVDEEQADKEKDGRTTSVNEQTSSERDTEERREPVVMENNRCCYPEAPHRMKSMGLI